MNDRLVVIAALCFAALESDGIPIEKVHLLVADERTRQDLQWGGPKHDHLLSEIDWLLLIVKHVGKLAAELIDW